MRLVCKMVIMSTMFQSVREFSIWKVPFLYRKVLCISNSYSAAASEDSQSIKAGSPRHRLCQPVPLQHSSTFLPFCAAQRPSSLFWCKLSESSRPRGS